MMKSAKIFFALLFFWLFAPPASAVNAHLKHYTAAGAGFEEVRDNIVFAINGRGYVINNVSHVGDMLERTGKDLGAAKQIYLKAESLEFCSAVMSRRMMEADPHNIAYCPYIINIYVLPKEPKTVHISFRKFPLTGSTESKKSLQAVEKLLDEIIREALE